MGGIRRRMFRAVLLFSLLSGCVAQELTIMPAMPVQAKPIGKKVLLTCRAPDEKLITQLEWLDPQNNTISNDNLATRDRLSVEKMMPDTKALIFSSLKSSEAGVYTCTAVYAGSKTLRKSVRIETIYAITWIDAPEEQYPIVGSKYKVKCKVEATPSPIVDWLRNGQQIHSTSNDRYVIDKDGLVIKNVTVDDDGIYICRAIVLDTGELSERNIKVEVHIPPSFEQTMPTTVEVVEGESASVTCMARGKPKPHYSWIRSDNDLNLASSERSTVNENTGVLTITRVSKEDNGEIRCMAANAAGSMERTVNLVVIIKPQVMEIKNITVPVKRRAQLVCRATGNPEPAITFMKIGLTKEMVKGAQPADTRVVVETRAMADGVTEAYLIIDDLTRPDDGLYTCIARNKGGESRKNGHLTVEFPPNFDNTPIKEAWSWNRIPVNLTCLAESIPNATITWKFNDRDIEKNPNYKKFGNGPQSTLLVTPLDMKYYGVYKCTATNLHGEVYHTIKLTEASAPAEILQAIQDVVTATTITFSFKGPSNNGGRPIKAFQVQYKGELEQGWSNARNRTWAFGSPYILEGLRPQTAYVFRFAAINDVGMSHWAAQQTVMMPKRSFPEEPKILHPPLGEDKYIVSPYHNRYELAWRIPADNGEPIDRYDIKYCIVQKVNNEWHETDDPCVEVQHRSLEVASYELRGLHSDTFYKVEIRARNVIGFSVPGQLVVKTARGSDHNGPSKHMDQTHLSSTTIISIVVAVLLVILVIVDVSCFFVNNTGILFLMCGKSKRSKTEDDPKLGSEGKELLNNGHRDLKVQIESAPMLEKKDTTVEFDLKKATSKTSFVGKDSAV